MAQRKCKLGQSGFSLLEIMVAAGLLGIISYVMMQMSKTQTTVQKRMEVSFELSTMTSQIAQTLLNQDACKYTLGVGQNISNGNIITSIKNRNNTAVFTTGETYGGMIKFNSMNLADVNIAASPGYGDLNLLIRFDRINKTNNTTSTISKKFNLRIEVDGSNNLIKCYSATENAVGSANQQSCEALDGTYDSGTNSCSLASYPQPLSDNIAVSNQYLSDYETELDIKYINSDSNDTMNGNLQVNGSITAQNFIYNSDARLKKNIHRIKNPEQILSRLNGYSFNWKEDEKEDIGLIAQNVEKTLPQLVYTNEDGIKSVAYAQMIALLIEVNKKQENKINELIDKIKVIEGKINQ